MAPPTSLGLVIFFVRSSSSKSTALTYPVPLEAILTAEVRFLAQLLASRALQAAGVVVAIGTLAFALLVDGDIFCWCLVHGGCVFPGCYQGSGGIVYSSRRFVANR